MTDDERLREIHDEVKGLRGEVKDFAKVSLQNQSDISWIKGNSKIVFTIFSTVVVSIILYLIKGAI